MAAISFQSECNQFIILTGCVWLAVVLSAVLHFDRRQTERFDHFVRSHAPVRRAEGQDGERQGKRGQRERQEGTVPPRQTFQHRAKML